MESFAHTSPPIDIQPKKTRISLFKRTRISRISRTQGRVSQTMRDEYFLIRGEYHEFYHPDGIRAIACATFGSYAISKVTPQKD